MKKGEAITLLTVILLGWLSFVSIMAIGNTSEIRVNLTKIESIFKDIAEIKIGVKEIKALLEERK